MKRTAFAALALACASTGMASAAISTFDDLSLSSESYWNGQDDRHAAGSFRSGGVTYVNDYSPSFWSGFAYSNTTNVSDPGTGNQFSANTGGGSASTNYAVYGQTFVPGPSIVFDAPSLVNSIEVTNTTWATQSMLLGDQFAKKFGGESGNDADWFKLTITGFQGQTAGAFIDFYLADFRFANNGLDYILDQWTKVDLSSLGEVTGLGFTLSSSDFSTFGGVDYMNTPAYFAMDNLQFVPEPSTAVLAMIGLAPLLRRRRAA